MMEWTTTKPTVPGWYWYREMNMEQIVEVGYKQVVGKEQSLLSAWGTGGYRCAVSFMSGEWSSCPIPAPAQAKGEE